MYTIQIHILIGGLEFIGMLAFIMAGVGITGVGTIGDGITGDGITGVGITGVGTIVLLIIIGITVIMEIHILEETLAL